MKFAPSLWRNRAGLSSPSGVGPTGRPQVLAGLWANSQGGMTTHFVAAICALASPMLDWQPGPPMPRPSAGHAAALLDGRLWVVGGTNWLGGTKHWLDDVVQYDPAPGEWTTAGRLPTPVAYSAWADDGERLHVCGGSDGVVSLRSCIALSPVDGALRCAPMAPLPEARVYAGAAVCGGVLYVVGGSPSHADLTAPADTMYALDLGDHSRGWEQKAPLPEPIILPAVAAAGGKVYAFGGLRLGPKGEPVNLAGAWSYDPAKDAWARLPEVPVASRGMDAVSASDETILLIGGYTATADEAKRHGPAYGFADTVRVYDTRAQGYSDAGTFPYAAIGTAPVTDGERVYLTGGEDRMRSRTDRLTVSPLR